MGLTQKLGTIPLAILTDASNNVGIGAAPSGSYKLEVTGTAKVSGVLTLSSTISNGTYTYTLPSATGTLALTSALSGYLPLTGGTLTGALTGTSATFTSTITSNNAIGVEKNGSGTFGGGGRFYLYNAATTDGFLMQLNASNNIDYWSVTSNTASASPVITFTRAGAATFSSSVTATGLNLANSTNGYVGLRLEGTGTYAGSDWTIYASSTSPSSANDFIGFFNNSTTDGATADYKLSVFKNGNVGIGTSSPTSGSSFNRFLEINGGSVNSALCLSGQNVAGQATIGYDSGNLYIEALGNPTGTNNNILFSTTSVNSSFTRIERMRITSGGYTKATNSGSYYSSANGLFHEFLQSTGNQDSMWIYNTASSGYGLTINMPNTAGNGSNYFLRALNSTSSYFLYSNGSSTFSSDRNLKKNIETTRDGYLEDLMNLRVVKYNWNTQKDGEAKELGLIAQEVAEIFPSLVVDQSIPKTREIKQEDGLVVEEQYEVTQKGLKVSVLPFILLKAIQEQQALITSLQDRLTKGGL